MALTEELQACGSAVLPPDERSASPNPGCRAAGACHAGRPAPTRYGGAVLDRRARRLDPLLGPDVREFVLLHQPRYVADDRLTLKLAMLAGTGRGFLPDSLSAAEQQAQLLVPVLPGWALRAGVAHAVFPSRRGPVPAVRSFLDFPGAHMQGETLV